MTMTYNKEAIYDEQIAPLMAKILQITGREGIQMLASFALMDADPAHNKEPMLCTSYTEGDIWTSPELLSAKLVITGERKAVSAMVFDLVMQQAERL